ncbi:MAG: glucosylceramidase [Acidobacteriota bacterium]|nr:glucosylceramidase [Acidobacteriota bacterium]
MLNRRLALSSALLAAALSALCAPLCPAQAAPVPHVWLTTTDRASLLAPAPAAVAPATSADATLPRVIVSPGTVYQTMEGFGFALTGGSAQLLMQMHAAERGKLLQELFARSNGAIGVSQLRISIGSSDMNDHAYSLDDMPAGETDPALAHFSLAEDEKAVIPVLQQVLRIQPHLHILASPWSAPAWMKTNGDLKGGALQPRYYAAYAQYLVRFLQAMRRQGIAIDTLTVQNEPLNDKNTPSMVMQPEEQAVFIRDHLGPALQRAHLPTRIVLYDHNCDRPDYPITVLQDARARQYIAGSGFHLYGGTIDAMSQVHDAFPQKDLFFTEQMVVDTHDNGELRVANPLSHVVLGAVRNWSRNVLLWNLAADPAFGPHTGNGGCPVCEGAITLDGDTVTRNVGYYTIAQIAAFVPPDSVRIGSTTLEDVATAAFRTPAGHTVLVTANHGRAAQRFVIADGAQRWTTSVPAGGAATFVW